LPQFKPQKSLTFAVEARCIKNVGFCDSLSREDCAIHERQSCEMP